MFLGNKSIILAHHLIVIDHHLYLIVMEVVVVLEKIRSMAVNHPIKISKDKICFLSLLYRKRNVFALEKLKLNLFI
jgi:hypothetical protein